jgi:hypothetical protein
MRTFAGVRLTEARFGPDDSRLSGGGPPVHSTISAEPAGSVPEPSLNLPARSVQTRLTGNRVMGICEEMMGITNISSILRLSFEG